MSDAEIPKVGRAKGGVARAKALSPERRSEIARNAAKSKHAKGSREDVPTATHIGELKIGDLILPCAVLSDGTRLISQGGIAAAFGPVTGGWQMRKRNSEEHAGDLPPFLVATSLQPFISDDVRTLVSSPKRYKDPRGGPARIGLDATLIPKVCEVWLKARDASALTKIQKPVAYRAEVLMRGLADVGIVALVDEATGFQRDRAKDALAAILEAFIAKELQPWVQTFPTDYYQELFRLRGLDFQRDSVRRPQYFGVLTNDIVYKRLAPGVLDELRRVTPRNEDGRPRAKYFQSLTSNTGYPKLREHLGKVVMMMQLSSDYQDFKIKLEKFLPKQTPQIQLPFDQQGPLEDDDGKGI
jgi:hypothetical protein